jgi:hypothetical protein
LLLLHGDRLTMYEYEYYTGNRITVDTIREPEESGFTYKLTATHLTPTQLAFLTSNIDELISSVKNMR